MAISFRFRIIIKRQPGILIKSEQTLPENNNVLEIFATRKLYSTFPLFDTQTVDQMCTLFKLYFLNVFTHLINSSAVTNFLGKSNCIFFLCFFINKFKIIILFISSDSINIFQDSHRIYQVRFTFVKVFSVHVVACIHSAGNSHSNLPLINKNAKRVNFCDFIIMGTHDSKTTNHIITSTARR